MSDAEIARADQGALMVPLTAGCVVLAYNLPDVQGDLKLSRKAYTGIFLGEIKQWNDPLIAQSNPGVKLPNRTIATVVRQDGSGTTFAFTKNLDAVSEKWRSQFGPARWSTGRETRCERRAMRASRVLLENPRTRLATLVTSSLVKLAWLPRLWRIKKASS